MKRLLLVVAALLLLGACGHEPVRDRHPPMPPASRSPAPKSPAPIPAGTTPFNPCAPTRTHDERDYTPGGLYRPGEADSGPDSEIDVSAIPEPVPHDEPRSRYGNRSPYSVLDRSYRVLDSAEGYVERGVASWYGSKFNGRNTSSGEPYDICAFTAAHRTLPLPSYARVTNLDNGRSVIVRINDRGPFHEGRLIDLSYAAAVRLGVDKTGTAQVEVRAVSAGDQASPPAQSSPGALAPALPTSGRWTLQVGSFGVRDNARGLADRLEDADIQHVDIDRVGVDGRTLWRVLVGPVDAGDLDLLLAQLRRLGVRDPRVFSQ
jgi:rare lipoprotein A